MNLRLSLQLKILRPMSRDEHTSTKGNGKRSSACLVFISRNNLSLAFYIVKGSFLTQMFKSVY